MAHKAQSTPNFAHQALKFGTTRACNGVDCAYNGTHMCQKMDKKRTMTSHKDEEISSLRRQLTQMSDLLEAERAAARLPKNMDFVQVTRSELRAISDLGEKNPIALSILMMLAQTMNKQNAVMMSYETMQSITGKPRRSLSRAVTVLKNDNWIQIIKVGTANAYLVNQGVFWTDKGDKKEQFANFTAQVITTLGEQEKDLRQCPEVKLKRVPMVEPSERMILGNDQLPPPDQQDLELN